MDSQYQVCIELAHKYLYSNAYRLVWGYPNKTSELPDCVDIRLDWCIMVKIHFMLDPTWRTACLFNFN